MKVINNTPSIKFEDNIINFGNLKSGSKTTVNLTIQDAIHSTIRPGCMSCTRANAVQKGNSIEIEIVFTAQGRGVFEKSVLETLTSGQFINFKLKGNII